MRKLFERVYRRSLREANAEKALSLLSAPKTKNDLLGMAAAIFGGAEAYSGKEPTDKELGALTSYLAQHFQVESLLEDKLEEGLFKSERKLHQKKAKYVNNAENRKLGRVGQEYVKDEYYYNEPGVIPGALSNAAEAVIDKLGPQVCAAILGVAVLGGAYLGLHKINDADFEKMHQCENAVCQTYENDNDGTADINGGELTARTYYSDGKAHVRIRKEANPEWERQQSAIRQFHKSGHSSDAQFDENGIWPGQGSAVKGGGSNLFDYIYTHADRGFHDQPDIGTRR